MHCDIFNKLQYNVINNFTLILSMLGVSVYIYYINNNTYSWCKMKTATRQRLGIINSNVILVIRHVYRSPCCARTLTPFWVLIDKHYNMWIVLQRRIILSIETTTHQRYLRTNYRCGKKGSLHFFKFTCCDILKITIKFTKIKPTFIDLDYLLKIL